MAERLLPTESKALASALSAVRAGATPGPDDVLVCIMALARLDGRYDWAADEDWTRTRKTLDDYFAKQGERRDNVRITEL